jgi:hypothetical protein
MLMSSTAVERGAGPSTGPTNFDRIRDILSNHPAVLNLRSVIENNPFHKSDVLTHTERVERAGGCLLELNFISDPMVRERFSRYLEVKVDRYTRAELVYAATFLHDLGKGMNDPKTGKPILQTKEDGLTTTAFKHAAVGAPLAAEIAKSALGCSEVEAKYIQDIVEKHMEGFNLEAALVDKNEAQKEEIKADSLKKIGYNPVVILHTLADIAGSDHAADATNGLLVSLINSIFKIRIEQVSLATSNPIETLQKIEALAKRYGVIIVPGDNKGFMAAQLEKMVRAEHEPKVQAGKIQPDKVEGIIAKKVKVLIEKFEFKPGEPSADKIENSFDYNNELTRNPVILQITN